jgi:predicted hydrocarbon binding protein
LYHEIKTGILAVIITRIIKEMFMTEKTVSNYVIRIVMDVTGEVIGENGLRAMLNFAKMPGLFQNKPDYGHEKNFTDHEYACILGSYYDVLGASGAKSVFRMIGRAIGERTTGLGLFDAFGGLPAEERLFKSIELYTVISGRGSASMDDGVVVYDNTGCTMCSGIESKTPVCTIASGFLDYMVRWVGMDSKRSVETRCKAMGHETCRYEIWDKE